MGSKPSNLRAKSRHPNPRRTPIREAVRRRAIWLNPVPNMEGDPELNPGSEIEERRRAGTGRHAEISSRRGAEGPGLRRSQQPPGALRYNFDTTSESGLNMKISPRLLLICRICRGFDELLRLKSLVPDSRHGVVLEAGRRWSHLSVEAQGQLAKNRTVQNRWRVSTATEKPAITY
jgi:hypothetical protein